MTQFRTLSKLAIILAATGIGTVASAVPANGPERYFTGSDLFSLEWASDPEISPDGRTIAYVRESNDIMTDRSRPTIWLIDVATGAERPLLAGSGAYFSPRWSPDGSRLAYVASEAGSPQLFVRWMANGESAKITDLPNSPSALSWSPDGRRIAYSMFVPDDAPKLGAGPSRPDGAKWADPLEMIDQVTYRFDGAGYLKPGYRQIFVVPADGGTPRQLTFGATNAGGEVSWTPRRSVGPVQCEPLAQLAARTAPKRRLSNERRRWCSRGAYEAYRSQWFASRFARWPIDCLGRL